MKLAGPLVELLITSRRASTCRGIRSLLLSRALSFVRFQVLKRVRQNRYDVSMIQIEPVISDESTTEETERFHRFNRDI